MSVQLLIGRQFVLVLVILFASFLFLHITHAQNITSSNNASNRIYVSNLSDVTPQVNISKSINGTFNTSLSNNAMMSGNP
jgi:hypothetical protein